MRPWLWLYRPQVPTVRAQSVQVLHMAHAMAARGHEVTLCVDRVGDGDVLHWYGLGPVDGLRIVVLPRVGASFAFRATVLAWLARNRRTGVVYARSKRYAREIVRLRAGVRVVVEAHEVDSAQAAERGEDAQAIRRLEGEVLAGAAGVVANAPGTLDLLREVHGRLPPAVALPNGTGVRPHAGEGIGVGYAGSVRPWKDLDTLARAAALARLRTTIVADGAEHLVGLGEGFVTARPAVPHREVAETLAGFKVLALPLGRGLLPERLTSPLKLADYLATGRPVVAADLPSVHAVAGDAFVPYRPGDPADLARALRKAHDEGCSGPPRIRTWAERAAEVEAFVEGLP
jgi:glycosyltransferase involved in cell wall biosynthesis